VCVCVCVCVCGMEDCPNLEGFLLKQGEKGVVRGWKKRWFQQVGYKLFYFENKPDWRAGFSGIEKGFIDLSQVTYIKDVEVKNPENLKFEIHTPRRIYSLSVLKRDQLFLWIDGLNKFLIQLRKGHNFELLRTLHTESTIGGVALTSDLLPPPPPPPVENAILVSQQISFAVPPPPPPPDPSPPPSPPPPPPPSQWQNTSNNNNNNNNNKESYEQRRRTAQEVLIGEAVEQSLQIALLKEKVQELEKEVRDAKNLLVTKNDEKTLSLDNQLDTLKIELQQNIQRISRIEVLLLHQK